jgi:hypothetical protein
MTKQAAGRVSGQAAIAFDDVGQAVQGIHWAVERGLGGIMMPPLDPGGTFFFDPVLDPIWAAIQETGLPISQHGGAGVPSYSPPGMAAILTLAYEHTAFAAFLKRERAFSPLPSEYWASNCYAGISPFHPNQLAIETLGSGYEPAPGELARRTRNASSSTTPPRSTASTAMH